MLLIVFVGACWFTAYIRDGLVANWRGTIHQIDIVQQIGGGAISSSVGLDETFAKIFDLVHRLIPFETALILQFLGNLPNRHW